jgi:hypothetical protein
MVRTLGRILKAEDVRLEGSMQLEVEPVGTPPPRRNNIGSVTPQAQIVQQENEFVVVELTCSCGAKTHVKCIYADSQTGNQKPQTEDAAQQTPENAPGQTN